MDAVTTDSGAARVTGDRPSSPRRRWPWLSVAVLLVALLAAAIAVWRQASAAPGDDSPEAGFARDMSTHHQQAVEMALIVLDRTDDPLVKSLATDIILTQTNQIGQMLGWLDVWGLPPTGTEPPMAWMGHGMAEGMPGMASPEEIAHMQELTGEDADREFLQLMIRHHEGALPMAQAILEQTSNPVVRRLAASMITSQQAEIETMTAMLERKGGAPIDASGAAPATPDASATPPLGIGEVRILG